jgi:hypothetical protein
MFSIGFMALVVPAFFVAFVTVAAFTGIARPRRLLVLLRSVARMVLGAASAFWALAVLFFRISTVVGFLSIEFVRAAALLFEVPARVVLLALF